MVWNLKFGASLEWEAELRLGCWCLDLVPQRGFKTWGIHLEVDLGSQFRLRTTILKSVVFLAKFSRIAFAKPFYSAVFVAGAFRIFGDHVPRGGLSILAVLGRQFRGFPSVSFPRIRRIPRFHTWEFGCGSAALRIQRFSSASPSFLFGRYLFPIAARLTLATRTSKPGP